MKLSELQFEYPEDLIATEPQKPSRVMWVKDSVASEISLNELVQRIPTGDVLVLNNTKVLKRRIFIDNVEILFLTSVDRIHWDVLFPSKKFKVGDVIELPLGRRLTLLEKGRPQKVRIDEPLPESYFEKVAELPLPPYIQKARGDRHTVKADESWYQTAWAKNEGSLAAPTASLHFNDEHLRQLRSRGVEIVEITLHVGLGTFLPVTCDDLDDHEMHEEYYEIPSAAWEQIQASKRMGHGIWSLGTTATRAIESAARTGVLTAFTRLLLQPGSEFLLVTHLLTNFHQPQSTLLALVFAFAGKEKVQKAYAWAIERKFRLFSYGDLSVWSK